MTGNRTFMMIKPSTVKNSLEGKILSKIQESGFRIVALKKTQMSRAQAGVFYEVHKERPFYQDLMEFMSSGPVVAAILEKQDAV